MITIITGTNRAGSESRKISEQYHEKLKAHLPETRIEELHLEDMPIGYDGPTMFDERHPEFSTIMEDKVVPASRFVFVVPEYHGSIPGALKVFFDACEVERCFQGKFAALVGVSSGRAGNIIGLEHLTSILNHMKVNVLHDKVKISSLRSLKGEDGDLADDETLKRLDAQINGLKRCVE
jgi:NAD(P)H-dependent FMN reductase